MSHIDSDPTPAHGTPRPTKTHVLDRQITDLRAKRAEIVDQIQKNLAHNDFLLPQLDRITEDISTLEQLLIDLFPEPRD